MNKVHIVCGCFDYQNKAAGTGFQMESFERYVWAELGPILRESSNFDEGGLRRKQVA
jgi:hypothetical protein